MRSYAFLVLLIVFCGFSTSIVLECEFLVYSDSGYGCNAKNFTPMTSIDDQEIIEVIGKHREGKSNDDVKVFDVNEIKIKSFPRGLMKFFKNIDSLVIERQHEIPKITKNDFKEFGDKLKNLLLFGNGIKVIEADFFEFNKNLELIDLRVNKITHIEDGTFRELKKLKTLWLEENPCTSNADHSDNDRSKTVEIIRRAEVKCKAEKVETIESTTITSTTPGLVTTTEDPIITELAEKISSLSSNLTLLLETLKARNAEVEKFTLENSRLQSENEKLID